MNKTTTNKRKQLARIIFDADTPAGKLYDVVLIIMILLSVVVAMLDSMKTIQEVHGTLLKALEWTLTILFTIDYFTRIACVQRPLNYILSFFGLIDLLSIIPTYLQICFRGSNYLATLRFLRILRTFRVLQLSSYQREFQLLKQAVYLSHRRIVVFLFFVITLVVVLGSLMYTLEHDRNPQFSDIPSSIYWAIVTLTTVGYGDISPQTPLGRTVAATLMILGYSIIVVPTGIVVSSLPKTTSTALNRVCPHCHKPGHDLDAGFCKYCSGKLRKIT